MEAAETPDDLSREPNNVAEIESHERDLRAARPGLWTKPFHREFGAEYWIKWGAIDHARRRVASIARSGGLSAASAYANSSATAGLGGFRRFFEGVGAYESRGKAFLWQGIRLAAANVLFATHTSIWLAARKLAT
jgi:hypothetical protein